MELQLQHLEGAEESATEKSGILNPKLLLHVLRAPLLVKQEAEYAATGGGLAPIARDAEGAVRELCRGADPKAREKAGELFEVRNIASHPLYSKLPTIIRLY